MASDSLDSQEDWWSVWEVGQVQGCRDCDAMFIERLHLESGAFEESVKLNISSEHEIICI